MYKITSQNNTFMDGKNQCNENGWATKATIHILSYTSNTPKKIIMMQLRKAMGSFIWAQKSPRIKREILTRTKNQRRPCASGLF